MCLIQLLEFLVDDVVELFDFPFKSGIFLKNFINSFEIKGFVPLSCLSPELVGLLSPVALLSLINEVGARLGPGFQEDEGEVSIKIELFLELCRYLPFEPGLVLAVIRGIPIIVTVSLSLIN